MGTGVSKPFHQLTVSDAVGKQTLLKVNASDSLRQVLEVLAKNRILSSPVTSPSGDIGFIDVLDVVAYLSTSYIGKRKTIADKSSLDVPCKQAIDSSGRNPIMYVTPKTLLTEVLNTMATQRVHRLAVVDEQDTRHSNILRVISQTDVFNQIVANSKMLFGEANLKKTLFQLKMGFKNVATCDIHDTTTESYWKMISLGFSALGVVNRDGVLVGILSGSEIRGLTEDNIGDLEMTVEDFLLSRNTIFLVCTPENTLEEVLNMVHTKRLHRIFIVNKENRPVGLLSLTDFIHEIHTKTL